MWSGGGGGGGGGGWGFGGGYNSGPPPQQGGNYGGGGYQYVGAGPQFGGGSGGGYQMQGSYGEKVDVFVEVSPEVQPNFARNGAAGDRSAGFVLEVPPIRVRLLTNCNPAPPHEPGLSPFKPAEEFSVVMPGLQRVFFDASGRPQGQPTSQIHKRGAVLEVPQRVTLDAQVKCNSPYGSLVLEDLCVQGGNKQKVGETVLNYNLQVQGELSVNKGGGNCGSNRLEVDLDFIWSCQMGGNAMQGGCGGGGGAYMQGGQMGGPMGGPMGGGGGQFMMQGAQPMGGQTQYMVVPAMNMAGGQMGGGGMGGGGMMAGGMGMPSQTTMVVNSNYGPGPGPPGSGPPGQGAYW